MWWIFVCMTAAFLLAALVAFRHWQLRRLFRVPETDALFGLKPGKATPAIIAQIYRPRPEVISSETFSLDDMPSLADFERLVEVNAHTCSEQRGIPDRLPGIGTFTDEQRKSLLDEAGYPPEPDDELGAGEEEPKKPGRATRRELYRSFIEFTVSPEDFPQAMLYAESGQWGRATEIVCAALNRAVNGFRNGPTVMRLLTMKSTVEKMSQVLERLLSDSRVAEPQIARLMDAFAAADNPADLKLALLGEIAFRYLRVPRGMENELASDVWKDFEPGQRLPTLRFWSWGLAKIRLRSLFNRVRLRFQMWMLVLRPRLVDTIIFLNGVRYRNEREFLRIAVERTRNADKEYPERLEGEKTIRDRVRELGRRFAVAKGDCQIFDCADIECLKTARARVAVAALKVRWHEMVHEKLPETIEEVQAPKDPYTGQELRYRHNGTAFTVYSVGPDLVDSGGDETIVGEWRPVPKDVVFSVGDL